MSNAYREFLKSKVVEATPSGIEFPRENLNPQLFNWQGDIVQWALRRGKAALFADCGMGKGPMQIEWARIVAEHTEGDVLILAPLAVAQQTVREGAKFGVHVTLCRSQSDVRHGVNVTNYEMLEHFSPGSFVGVVLDESSRLKSFGGVQRKQFTEFGSNIPFRLACTATPAPNDLIEVINHAEFLSVMQGKEIIALYFTQDGNTTHSWRLKGHARKDFWRWVATWAVALRKPSDIGYPDEGFILPQLEMKQITVPGVATEGMLFAVEALSLAEQRRAKRGTLATRVKAAADLVNSTPGQWLVWAELNAESEALCRAIPGAIEVTGNDSPGHKEQAAIDFVEGRVRVIVSKTSIFGFGLNLQCCGLQVFVGLSHSFEQLYQAIRRSWRFGRLDPVTIWQIVSENEGNVLDNLRRKERQANEMMDELVRNIALTGLSLGHQRKETMTYEYSVRTGRDWTAHLGDSIEVTQQMKAESVDLTLFSPPFPGMYAYTNSEHDIGNTVSIEQMIEHFGFLIPGLFRVIRPGRITAIHLMQLTAMLSRDGYIGIKDYRGRTIEAMESHGFVYAGEVCIDKNPQIQATRNKERGLMFKTLATDSSLMRMALADYLIYFRKPGSNVVPIRSGISQKYANPDGWITEDEWIEWAAPVWYRHMNFGGRAAQAQPGYPSLAARALQSRKTANGTTTLNGIMETDVLNVAQARETDDERHLCPLQRCVAERAVKLYSAPGETVFSPFMGIGTEGVAALSLNRRFVGIELKRSYYESAIGNLEMALAERGQQSLFDTLEDTAS